MSEHRDINPDDIDPNASEQSYDETLDAIRRSWRLDRELKIEDFPGSPMPIRLCRHMARDEMSEPAIVTIDPDEPEPRTPFVYIYSGYFDTQRMLSQLRARLSRSDMMGSDELAWALILHVEKRLGIEREAAIEAYKAEHEEMAKLFQAREGDIKTRALAEKAAADAKQLGAGDDQG